VPHTKGFRDKNQLHLHHQKHQSEFGFIDEKNYLNSADAFLGSPKSVDVLECIRKSDNSIMRYNPKTNEFGVITQDSKILTYFKPNLTNKIKYPTSLDYFKEQCKK
jgi:filamentous hemagglutinin